MAPPSFLLFSGNSNPQFAAKLAKELEVPLGKAHFHPFPDGEFYIQIGENVRGRDVFVVQSIAKDPNNYLVELLLMIDALKRASAKSIIALIPYFGYARQDRKDKPRVPISAKLLADLLATAGATRILTMDLHAEQIQGFFDIPVDHLYSRPCLSEKIASLSLKNLVIVAPDLGAIKMAQDYAMHLSAEFAVIDKRRITSERVEIGAIIGQVDQKEVVLVDDMCSTGSTLLAAAAACKAAGAKKIFAAFTHALLVGGAEKKLSDSVIEKIFTTDTVAQPGLGSYKKIEQLSVTQIFAQAIRRIMLADSVSSIFI